MQNFRFQFARQCPICRPVVVFARSHCRDVLHAIVVEAETNEVRIGDSDAVAVRGFAVRLQISSNQGILLVLFWSKVFAKVAIWFMGNDRIIALYDRKSSRNSFPQ